MKMSLTVPGGARGAWLVVGRSAAGAVLVAVAVSACTTGKSTPSTFTPTPQTNGSTAASAGTRTPSPSGKATRSSESTAPATHPGGVSPSGARPTSASVPATTSASVPATASASASANPSVTTILPTTPPATAPASQTPFYPTAAPETGGGGTAGLQDGLLLGIGGAAVAAGLGSLAYRRRLARKLRNDQSARRSPADREPADQ